MEYAQQIVDFLHLSERLKCELRHSFLSSGRRESVAEHTWQMALLALISYRHLEHRVDIAKALKMILVHDLVEAETGDVPFFRQGQRKQKEGLEQQAIANIRDSLDRDTGREIFELFQDYETSGSPEARFVKALDSLEVQIQHNLADLESWEEIEYDLVYTKMDQHCEHDRFLRKLCAMVKRESEAKMIGGGIDVDKVKRRSSRRE
jgi:putative hydrolase of HD superfamily